MRHKSLAFEKTKLVYLNEPEASAGCRTWVAHSEKKNPFILGIKQIKFHFPNCGRIINYM